MNSERKVKGILGRKLGMTQLWDENNKIIPVTVIEAGPCVVTQIRTTERDGYAAAIADFSVDYTYGLTDEQLNLHVRCAIDTMVTALTWLDSKYPAYAVDERG